MLALIKDDRDEIFVASESAFNVNIDIILFNEF
jgi:hypothetical protein